MHGVGHFTIAGYLWLGVVKVVRNCRMSAPKKQDKETKVVDVQGYGTLAASVKTAANIRYGCICCEFVGSSRAVVK